MLKTINKLEEVKGKIKKVAEKMKWDLFCNLDFSLNTIIQELNNLNLEKAKNRNRNIKDNKAIVKCLEFKEEIKEIYKIKGYITEFNKIWFVIEINKNKYRVTIQNNKAEVEKVTFDSYKNTKTFDIA